jgi:hypothetical protein
MRPLHLLPTIHSTPKPAESLKAHDAGPGAPKPAAAQADSPFGLKNLARGEATGATSRPRAKLGQLAKLFRKPAGPAGPADPSQKRAADRLAAQRRKADPAFAVRDRGFDAIRQNLSDTIRNSSRDRLAAPLNKKELDLAAQAVAQVLGKSASRAEQAVGALVGYDLYKPAPADQPVSQANADAFKLLRALASMPDPGGARAAASLLSGAVQNPMLNAKQMQLFAAAADLVDPQRLATHPDQLIAHVDEQLAASGGKNSAQPTSLLEQCKSALLGGIVASTATSLPGTKSANTLSELKRGGLPEQLQLRQGSPVLSGPGPGPGSRGDPPSFATRGVQTTA